jgi:hypothetical protein
MMTRLIIPRQVETHHVSLLGNMLVSFMPFGAVTKVVLQATIMVYGDSESREILARFTSLSRPIE